MRQRKNSRRAKAAFQGQLDQMRKAWSDAAKTPSAKAALEGACKQSAEQTKSGALRLRFRLLV